MESVPCNLCGSNHFSVLYRGPDLLLDHKEELFTMVRCNDCGSVYQNPRPSAAEIGKYYPEDYDPYYEERPTNWLVRKVNQAGVDKRCRLVNSIPNRKSGGRLLDIGCSTGLFMDKLRQTKTWEVWGVEPSEHAVKIAQERYQLNVFHGDLFQADFPDGFYDVITMWDVLEHLPDPSGALDEIARITKPKSYLILRVPNRDSLDAKLFARNWAGLDMPRHFYVFSRRNLAVLLDKHGYEITQISGNIGVYPTFLLSLRFWLTNREVDSSLREKIFAILNHPVMKLFTAPFFYFYGLLLLGTGMTVVAKKK